MVVSDLPLPCLSWYQSGVSTHYRNPPKVEIGADGIARYRGEADGLESPSSARKDLFPPVQLIKYKRYDPYGSPPGKKEYTKSSHSESNIAHTAESISPLPSTISVLLQPTPVPGYATDTFSPHHPPYGVPAYLPVSTYPPHVPPAAHTYHPGPPPVSSHQSTSSQSQQSVVQYNYPGYTPTPHRSNPSHPGHGTQHGYYPYYLTPTTAWGIPHALASRASSTGRPSTTPAAYPKHEGNGDPLVKSMEDKEKPPKVQLDNVYFYASSSVSSKSVAFISL
jgi:hypothetical protein